MIEAILIETVSNVIWVFIVFVFIFFRDRKKQQQINQCLEAYLTYLIRSTALIRNSIYPYIFLVDSKVIEGKILSSLLESIQNLCNNLESQTQEALALSTGKLSERILKLHQLIILFQAHVSESLITTDLVVGNPTELITPPKQQEEMEVFRQFYCNFEGSVRELLEIFPKETTNNIPQEILNLLEQKNPFQKKYDK